MARRTPRSAQASPATPVPRAEPAMSAVDGSQAPRTDRIAQRAYNLYERRGSEDGHAIEDWLQAEREVDAKA